ERAGRTSRRQKSDTCFEFGQLNVLLAFHCPSHIINPAQISRKATFSTDRLTLGTCELQQFLVTCAEDLSNRTALKANTSRVNGGKILRFPENSKKTLGLASRT